MAEQKGRGCKHVVLDGAEPVTHVVISDHVVAACATCCVHFEAVASELDEADRLVSEKRRVAAG